MQQEILDFVMNPEVNEDLVALSLATLQMRPNHVTFTPQRTEAGFGIICCGLDITKHELKFAYPVCLSLNAAEFFRIKGHSLSILPGSLVTTSVEEGTDENGEVVTTESIDKYTVVCKVDDLELYRCEMRPSPYGPVSIGNLLDVLHKSDDTRHLVHKAIGLSRYIEFIGLFTDGQVCLGDDDDSDLVNPEDWPMGGINYIRPINGKVFKDYVDTIGHTDVDENEFTYIDINSEKFNMYVNVLHTDRIDGRISDEEFAKIAQKYYAVSNYLIDGGKLMFGDPDNNIISIDQSVFKHLR